MLLVQKLYVTGAKAVCYWCKSCMLLVQRFSETVENQGFERGQNFQYS